MKLHKFELYVFDHENYGVGEYVRQLENMRHCPARVKLNATADIGDWDDSHELNQSNASIDRYRSYFEQPAAPAQSNIRTRPNEKETKS
jgi:hypothetical protein